jgi:hypothetical protein
MIYALSAWLAETWTWEKALAWKPGDACGNKPAVCSGRECCKAIFQTGFLPDGRQRGNCMDPDDTQSGDACEQMLLHMSCALDGALAVHEQAALSAHMACCASCRTRAAKLDAADRLLRTVGNRPLEALAPDVDVVRQVMARVRLEARPLGGVLEFTRLVAQDPALHDQFRPAGNMESFVALFVSAGRQHGYRFGRGEVVSLLNAGHAANDDLSDAQLDAVVGGVQNDSAVHAFLNDVLQNWFKPIA